MDTLKKIDIKLLALISALLLLLNNSFFNLDLGNFYFLFFIFCFIYLIIFNKIITFNKPILILVIASAISLLVNEIPKYIQAKERFLIFLIFLLLLSPLIVNFKLKLYRLYTFKLLNNLIISSILISFIILQMNFPLAYNESGPTGIYSHSMILGPLAGISVINTFYRINISKNIKYKIFFLIVLIISLLVCIKAGSRGALISCALASIFFIFRTNSLVKFFKLIAIFLIAFAFSLPLITSSFEALEKKAEFAESQGSTLASRESIWIYKLNEFKQSPVFGVGFSNDTRFKSSIYMSDKKIIEPGSSWLYILSSLGLLGFIAFVFIAYTSFSNNINPNIYNPFSIYLNSLLIFFYIHMLFEGYIVSAGSFLFFYFWLLLSVKMNQKSIIKIDPLNKFKSK